MEVKDWRQVEDIFHAALDLGDDERAAYLARACSGDTTLRGEVESLLSAFEGRRGFMEEPVFGLGMKMFADDAMESLAGRTVGPYRLEEMLGRGGMGEVYLAEDTRLGRKVALKFLSAKLVDDNWAKRQLAREAQAVAMLDHPNICAVHGIEEIDGYSFIVMQYVRGETLSHLIRARRPDVSEAVVLATQMAGALSEAHAHGIIHRDVKPQNVVVGADGQVKVLDFGLAKLVQRRQQEINAADNPSQFSQAGLVMGTVAYMSPEQLRAERLDFRSDIFSLGTVLYELISGNNPFARASDAETISAILTDTPPPLTRASADVPAELNRIILKCLEKDKERRYQSASELLYDLGGFQEVGAQPLRRLKSTALRLTAAFFLLLLLVAVSMLIYQRLTSRVYTLAVLPFNNESADASVDYLGDGLAESLIQRLSRLPRLRVKALTTVSGYQGREIDAPKLGRDLNVDAVLTGTIVREGDSLVLRTALIKTADGSPLWHGRYNLDAGRLPDLHDMTEKIAVNLQPRIGGDERRLIAASDTENQEAYRHYLRGRHYWRHRNKDNILKAIESFNEAIKIDPAYARAYAGLADCYVLMNTVAYGDMETKDAMTRARWAAKEALKIDDTLPEAHTSLAVVNIKYDWNWQEAERELKRALMLDPDYAPAHYWYSNLLAVTGRHGEAIAEGEISKYLDPFSARSGMNFCRTLYYDRQFDRAATCLRQILENDPADPITLYVLGYVYLQQGMSDEAAGIFLDLYAKDKHLAAAPLAYVYGRAGRTSEAMMILTEAEEMSRRNYLPPLELAIIYMGLDKKDEAFILLERAYQEKFASLIYLPVDPLFDSLRSDARFDSLIQRLNLMPPPTLN